MSDKYYTPEIEEFHVGFEYEIKRPFMTNWNKRVFFSRLHDPTHIPNAACEIYEVEKEIKESAGRYNRNTGKVVYVNESIRVKHLDREDIESFDFNLDKQFTNLSSSKSTSVYVKTMKYRGDDANLMLIYNSNNNWACMSWSNHAGGAYLAEKRLDKLSIPIVSIHISNTIFAGVIKNKSEFRKILKQTIDE